MYYDASVKSRSVFEESDAIRSIIMIKCMFDKVELDL